MNFFLERTNVSQRFQTNHRIYLFHRLLATDCTHDVNLTKSREGHSIVITMKFVELYASQIEKNT